MERTRDSHRPSIDIRMMASERIYRAFNDAPVVFVRYMPDYAFAYCEWNDGVREYMFVDYADLLPEGQHDRAMEYAKTLV